jgi:hypothetical protein
MLKLWELRRTGWNKLDACTKAKGLDPFYTGALAPGTLKPPPAARPLRLVQAAAAMPPLARNCVEGGAGVWEGAGLGGLEREGLGWRIASIHMFS